MPAMNHRFASKCTQVAESGTTRIFTLAKQLQQQGREIINLAVGEPHFETAAPIIQATQAALNAQATRYGPVAGEPALRSALAQAFPGYTQNNILITNGAKQALYSLFQILCNPGDEIILPRPCWVSFPEQIKLAGGVPVWVDTPGHQIDPSAVEQRLSPRTRAILINSPNNPTGAVYGLQSLTEISNMASRHGISVIADEAYEAFTFDDLPRVRLFDLSEDKQPIITVRSFSKQFNMTGFRLGYVAAATPIIEMLVDLQSHLCGNVCTFAQHGALAALSLDADLLEQQRLTLQHLRDMAYTRARALFDCIKPRGAFYLFPDAGAYLQEGESDADLAQHLLEQTGVAVVPGQAFGQAGHLRISFAIEAEKLERGFDKITEFLKNR
jgi:aspartate aminotransferase